MISSLDRVIILADESANWEVGGLRQLDRLTLALDEFARSISSQRKVDIVIFWRPDIAAEQRWRPENPRLSRCQFVEGLSVGASARLLNTRLLVRRGGLEQLLGDAFSLESDPTIADESAVWNKLSQRIENEGANSRSSPDTNACCYLASAKEILPAERWLLRASGKSHDGFVSRYLNRPVSRAVSRLLLKTSMTPNRWTWLITLLPLIGFLLLVRGDYFGFVTGAAFFQIHSIFDGCDGEIARAKYLDSEKGPGLDALGDLIALLLFSLGLGFGLFRTADTSSVVRWTFLGEGVLAFLFIAARLGPHTLDLLGRGPAAVVSSEHDESLRNSGGRILGARLTAWAFELTKRDVVFLAFLVLAALGLAQSILHLLFVYSLATLLLRHQSRR